MEKEETGIEERKMKAVKGSKMAEGRTEEGGSDRIQQLMEWK